MFSRDLDQLLRPAAVRVFPHRALLSGTRDSLSLRVVHQVIPDGFQAFLRSAIGNDFRVQCEYLVEVFLPVGNQKGAEAGDLVLAARCLGALDALGALAPPDQPGPPGQGGAVDKALAERLTGTAYATYFEEGRAGGAGLVTALYPR